MIPRSLCAMFRLIVKNLQSISSYLFILSSVVFFCYCINLAKQLISSKVMNNWPQEMKWTEVNPCLIALICQLNLIYLAIAQSQNEVIVLKWRWVCMLSPVYFDNIQTPYCCGEKNPQTFRYLVRKKVTLRNLTSNCILVQKKERW